MNHSTDLTRIAVFYDGAFFSKLNEYYRHTHTRRTFFDHKGFLTYLRKKVAEQENSDISLCHIVETHYFKGRFSLNAITQKAGQKEPETAQKEKIRLLENDRRIDEFLMNAGIVTHYYPMDESKTPPEEKGIDVWLALEAYDLAVHKRFDVLVLITADQDFVPLIRKVNGLGIRVFGVKVDISDANTNIKTSYRLLNETSYLINLSDDANTPLNTDKLIDGIFYSKSNA